jgi:hypothetical protein
MAGVFRDSFRKVLALLFLAAVLLLVEAPTKGLAGDSCDFVTPKNVIPASLEARAERLTTYLASEGYDVARGYFFLFGPEQMPVCH